LGRVTELQQRLSFKQIIEGNDTIYGRGLDLFIQALILLSVVTFSMETLPDLKVETRATLRWIEIITVLIFTAEYISRLFVADAKLKFVFSFYGLIDFLAVIPFYISMGVDLRSLRIFRLLRVIRIFKITRYSKAIDHLRRAFIEIKEELILFFILTVFMLYLAAVGIYYFENPAQPDKFSSIFESLWWAVTTLTTVGYGDAYPVTVGGRIFTFFILMIGLGVVAVPTGLLSSSLTTKR
jgi:voltage-gated potassium channel